MGEDIDNNTLKEDMNVFDKKFTEIEGVTVVGVKKRDWERYFEFLGKAKEFERKMKEITGDHNEIL